ncbi:unnamed protein product, partial [Ectocarpus sp. 12 AP-2014]
VAPPPVPERLVGFGELLRQAEHAQAQIGDSSDDDNNSNDSDDEGVDATRSDDNEDADDDEELDDLRDLSDDGSNQEHEQDEAVEEGEQPSSLRKGGKAESGTEEDKANDQGKDIPGPSELSSDDLRPQKDGKQKRRIYSCSKDQE